MRIYRNCVEAINEATRDLFARGIISFDPTVQAEAVHPWRDQYEMKELIGYAYTLLDGSDKEEMIEWARKHFKNCDITVKWAEAWFQDRISGKALNPEPSVKLRWNYWKDFIEGDRVFSYTYSERMAQPQEASIPTAIEPTTHLDRIVNALNRNRYMRGAVLSIWNPEIDSFRYGARRTPCSVYYQFLIRPVMEEDELTIIYTMRSCDLINHFASDVYCALKLGEYVAEKVDVKFGKLTHFIGSLHAYRKDVAEDRKW